MADKRLRRNPGRVSLKQQLAVCRQDLERAGSEQASLANATAGLSPEVEALRQERRILPRCTNG
ncbi:MAG: hypothetical protein ACR2PL_07570 [Dehalococcoidia bacterium]